MFVFSVKARYLKMLFAGLVIGAAAAAAICLFPDTPAQVPVNGVPQTVAESLKGIGSAEDVYALLTSLGYTADPQPLETVQVKVPARFDKLLQVYNGVQLENGFNLAGYGGKTVTRCTFRVTDVPQGMPKPLGEALVSVLLYRDEVIGGDLYDTGEEGSVSGFLPK